MRKILEEHPVKRTGPLLNTLKLVDSSDRFVLPSNVDDIVTAADGLCDIAFIHTGTGLDVKRDASSCVSLDLIQPSARFIFPTGSAFVGMFNRTISNERLMIGSLRRRYYDIHEKKRRQCYEEKEEGRLKEPLRKFFSLSLEQTEAA